MSIRDSKKPLLSLEHHSDSLSSSLLPHLYPMYGYASRGDGVSLPTHLRAHVSRWLRVFSCPWTFQAWGKFNSTDVMWKESKLPLPQIATGYRLSRKLAHSSVWADNTPSHSSCASYALCKIHDRCLCSYHFPCQSYPVLMWHVDFFMQSCL